MKILILALMFVALYSAPAFAEVNPQFARIMGCQTPDSRQYLEIFHDQEGPIGTPKNPIGYLVLWTTTMGKDTQKRLVTDVPMKYTLSGGNCVLDVKWSQKKYDGSNAISNFHAVVAGCNALNNAPKGKLTQEDVYPSGKVVSVSVDLNCQLQ